MCLNIGFYLVRQYLGLYLCFGYACYGLQATMLYFSVWADRLSAIMHAGVRLASKRRMTCQANVG